MRRLPMTRRLAFLTVISVLTATGCEGQLPTAPAVVASRTRIQNLVAKQLGLAHEVCFPSFQYRVHDELTFDVVGQPASLFIGGTVHHMQEDGTETLVAPITSCRDDITPCSATSACVRESHDSGGTIRVYANVPWTPERAWNVFIRSATRDSNRLNAFISRPDALPMGQTAAIAHMEARRSSATSGGYQVLVWSPGIVNRRIRLTIETWSGGTLIRQSVRNEPERTAGLTGSSGGITIGSGPSELVAIVEEFENNVLIATDRRTIPFI
jgi:hypothetical protein